MPPPWMMGIACLWASMLMAQDTPGGVHRDALESTEGLKCIDTPLTGVRPAIDRAWAAIVNRRLTDGPVDQYCVYVFGTESRLELWFYRPFVGVGPMRKVTVVIENGEITETTRGVIVPR